MKKPIILKKYKSFYIETAIQKILEVFFKYPEKEFSLTDISKLAGVAKSNLGNILSNLEKIDLIQITKLSNLWRIKANQNSCIFIKNKIIYNLNLIYQSSLIEFLDEYFRNPKAIILFGSFRKGDDISNSDIDIAIETNKFKEYKTTGLKELKKFEEMIGRKIQIHLFNKNNVDINVFNNIANGIVLFGFLEVKK